MEEIQGSKQGEKKNKRLSTYLKKFSLRWWITFVLGGYLIDSFIKSLSAAQKDFILIVLIASIWVSIMFKNADEIKNFSIFSKK